MIGLLIHPCSLAAVYSSKAKAEPRTMNTTSEEVSFSLSRSIRLEYEMLGVRNLLTQKA